MAAEGMTVADLTEIIERPNLPPIEEMRPPLDVLPLLKSPIRSEGISPSTPLIDDCPHH